MGKRFRIRHHVNPLKLGYQERPVERILPGPATEVEVGCAEAHWLVERAAVEPSWRYVGLEIREDLVVEVRQRVARLGLGARVDVRYANANTDLDRLFGAGEVTRFVVNFPDPWFKSWQHKRRLLTGALVRSMAECLRPLGELFFQSDVFDLALDAMALCEGEPLLTNAREAWRFFPENPFGVVSRRERKSTRQGRRVWRLLYRRDRDQGPLGSTSGTTH